MYNVGFTVDILVPVDNLTYYVGTYWFKNIIYLPNLIYTAKINKNWKYIINEINKNENNKNK